MHQGRPGTSGMKADSGCALGLKANLLLSSVPEEGDCVSPVRYWLVPQLPLLEGKGVALDQTFHFFFHPDLKSGHNGYMHHPNCVWS